MSDTNSPNEWHPPQEKYIRWGINGAIIAALVFGGSIVVKHVVPTISDAFLLLQTLTENMIYLALTVGALVVVGWLLLEILSPKGRINKLFAQAYSSFIHNMTLELLNVDPMSPLKDSLAAVEEKKKTYDEQFAQFDGQISVFKQNEDQFRAQALEAEKRAKAANSKGDTVNFERLGYQAGEANKTADGFAAMRARLEPVRGIIVRLQQAADDLIFKLGVDIQNTQATWDAANNMSKMERAARGILANQGKNELAKEAQMLVQTKYATAIGRLENLNDAAKPLLDNIDLDKATYSQDLLEKWQAEDRANQMVAIPVHASVVAPLAIPGQKTAAGGFGGLIDN